MSRRTLTACCIFCLAILTGAPLCAEPADIARYELALFGYRIGMTYDEATMVRPFHRVENSRGPSPSGAAVGVIDSLYLDDCEFKIHVYFDRDRITKVIGHFSPLLAEQVRATCRRTFGTAEDRSKRVDRKDGGQLDLLSYTWAFPGANIHLVASHGSGLDAVLSLVGKAPEPDGEVHPPADEAGVRDHRLQ